MKHLVLIRHGESEWNRTRRIQGQSGTGLSDLGRRQAARTAEWLASNHGDAAVLVTSDLERCVETAAYVEDALGRPARREEGLRERHFGDWTGELVDDVLEQHGDLFTRWRQGEDVVSTIGGESSRALSERVLAVLEGIAADLAEHETAVLITHGGPVWHGTHAWLELPEDGALLGGVANCSVTELVADGGWGRRLNCYNQVAHLSSDLQSWFRPSQSPPGRDAEGDGPPAVGQ